MISRNNKLCNSTFVLQRFENRNDGELKISVMLPYNQTLNGECEQLSQLQRNKKKKKKKEQKDGTQADCYPQTARAELKHNTSVSRSYITSYHSPNFTQTSQDQKTWLNKTFHNGWHHLLLLSAHTLCTACCSPVALALVSNCSLVQSDVKKCPEGGQWLWHSLTDRSADVDGFRWETTTGLTLAENRVLKKMTVVVLREL